MFKSREQNAFFGTILRGKDCNPEQALQSSSSENI